MNAQTRPNWWQRNLKWVILAAVLLALLFVALMLGAIIFVAVTAMRSNDVYRTAVARAQEHPAVSASLGQPVKPGLFTSGNIQIDNRSGEADLSIPLSGPEGEASISVVAHRRDGLWYYDTMQVVAPGAAPIELRQPEEIDAASEEPR